MKAHPNDFFLKNVTENQKRRKSVEAPQKNQQGCRQMLPVCFLSNAPQFVLEAERSLNH